MALTIEHQGGFDAFSPADEGKFFGGEDRSAVCLDFPGVGVNEYRWALQRRLRNWLAVKIGASADH